MPYGPLLTRQYGPNAKGSKLNIQEMDDNLLYLSESISIGTNNAVSASYAATASYALNASSPFPYTGSARITGSLGVTGSMSLLAYTGSAANILNIRNSANTVDLIKIQGDGGYTFTSNSNIQTLSVDSSGYGVYSNNHIPVSTYGMFFGREATYSTLAATATNTTGSLGTVSFTRTGVGGGNVLYVENSNSTGYNTGGNILVNGAGTLNTGLLINAAGASYNNALSIVSGSVGIGFPAYTALGARVDIKAQGALSTDNVFRVRNSANNLNLLSVNGDGSIGMGDAGGIALNTARLWVNASGSMYGIYSVAASGQYALYLASPNSNVVHGYYASSIGTGPAFKSEDPGGGSGVIKIGFAADSFGVNNGGYNYGFYSSVIPSTTGYNVGAYLDATGSSTANYAISINRGDIKFGVGTKIGAATTDLFAFWGATPVTQSTTAITSSVRVGGGGTTLTDTDTFDGYTVAQVVKALRTMGLLA